MKKNFKADWPQTTLAVITMKTVLVAFDVQFTEL